MIASMNSFGMGGVVNSSISCASSSSVVDAKRKADRATSSRREFEATGMSELPVGVRRGAPGCRQEIWRHAIDERGDFEIGAERVGQTRQAPCGVDRTRR